MSGRLKVAVLTVLVLALLLIAGCGSSSKDQPQQISNSSSDDQVKVVVDAYGRSVKVPAEVQSAAAVGSAARIVVYAGAKDKLIGIADFDKHPDVGMPYTIAAASLFATLPSTNSGAHIWDIEIDEDELVNLHPDVIISSRSSDECDALQASTGIPVVGVFYQNQLFTANVIDSIECVGEALGTEGHAQGVIAKMQEWERLISSRVSSIPTSDRVLVYFGGVSYLQGHGWEGSYANFAPAIVANVRNVANDIASDGYVEIDLDQLIEWNPSFMFLNETFYDELKETYDDHQRIFDALKAFQTGNIYTQPFYNYNGTNIETGICESLFVAAKAYPELFEDVNLEETFIEIYETMLDGYDFYEYAQSKGGGFEKFPSFA